MDFVIDWSSWTPGSLTADDGEQAQIASNFADRHGIVVASNSANQYGCIYRVFMDLIMSVFVLTSATWPR
jgi:hypothetical protein